MTVGKAGFPLSDPPLGDPSQSNRLDGVDYRRTTGHNDIKPGAQMISWELNIDAVRQARGETNQHLQVTQDDFAHFDFTEMEKGRRDILFENDNWAYPSEQPCGARVLLINLSERHGIIDSRRMAHPVGGHRVDPFILN